MMQAPLSLPERILFWLAAIGLLLAVAITHRAPRPRDDFFHPIPRRRL